MSRKPKLLVFASGGKSDGGSGFQKLVENSYVGILNAEIVGAVSNYEHGGVRQIADYFSVPFFYFPGPFEADEYSRFFRMTNADFASLSGWLKLVSGLDPAVTLNIHPGLLPDFGGPGMFGNHVHDATIKAYRAGDIDFSAVTMHFVTEGKAKADYDTGPKFFEHKVYISVKDDSDSLMKKVNKVEHGWQSFITNLVVQKQIKYINEKSISTPAWYKAMPFFPKRIV